MGPMPHSPEDKAGRGAWSRMSRNSPCLGWFAVNGEGHLERCLSFRGENPSLWCQDVWGCKRNLSESIVLLRLILRIVQVAIEPWVPASLGQRDLSG